MFRTTAATAPPTRAALAEALIPLSVLRLDLPEPAQGWAVYLAGFGIATVTDDIGREAISRGNAKMLLDEQREREARRAEILARADAAAIEFDREWRSQLRGVPADMIPAGMAPAAAMFAAELDSHAYQPRRASMAEDLFDNSGEITFHPLAPATNEE
jgi:hypothetical protein